MDTVISNILEGKFEYERGTLSFSCAEIQMTIPEGTNYEGSFIIYGPKGKQTEGYLIVTDCRMECPIVTFSGEQDEIFFCFHGEKMKNGDVARGEFYIVSNRGEFHIPYEISVEECVLKSSMGDIRNLFHFVNLAKTNWDEALKLFYNPDFSKILTGSDAKFRDLYKALSGVNGNNHNMDEFLVEINKKSHVELVLSQNCVDIVNPDDDKEYEIIVSQNGWGYLGLQLEVEGEFIALERKHVTANDFLGSNFCLRFYLLHDKLHLGNNEAYICIKKDLDVIKVPVNVTMANNHRALHHMIVKRKQNIVSLMECYKSYRLKKITTKTWLVENEKIIHEMLSRDEQDLEARLYRVQLLITQERNNEARWELEQINLVLRELKNEKPELWGYYLYLSTLMSEDELFIEQAADEIQHLNEEDPYNFRLAWLVMYLKKEENETMLNHWMWLENQFVHGSYSPILYLEASQMLTTNPTLLTKLDPYELQVLNFVLKNGLMNSEIISQVLSIAGSMKEYSPFLLNILERCYGDIPQDELLQMICSQYIKGNRVDQKAFGWYAIAVKQELRITRLFDYYILAVDLEQEIELPKMVLMYFSFHSDLDYHRNAYLFSYVCKHREVYPELYEKYLPQIQEFVIDQIDKQHIDKALAYLYHFMITENNLSGFDVMKMSKLLFVRSVRVTNEELQTVRYICNYVTSEHGYNITNGRGFYPAFLDGGVVVLERENGDRYVRTSLYQEEALFRPIQLSFLLAPYVSGNVGFDLFQCMNRKENISISEETVERFRNLVDVEWLDTSFRQEIAMKLQEFYDENDRIDDLIAFQNGLTLDRIDSRDWNRCLQLLINRSNYDKAYEWIKDISYQGLDAKTIVRLCCGLLTEMEPEELAVHDDPLLENMMLYTLEKGKSQESIVRYLADHYDGTLQGLRRIYRSGKELGIDLRRICELILIRMLYHGGYVAEKDDIYAYYVAHDPDDRLIEAIVTQGAYDYFVKQSVVERYIFDKIPELAKKKTDSGKLNNQNLDQKYSDKEYADLQMIIGMAYVKYCAENPSSMTEEQKALISHFLWEQINHDIVLPCYKDYISLMPQFSRFLDKTVIEYHTKPGNRVVIHYMLGGKSENGSEYCTEEMQAIYDGVFTKVFIVFFGENIQYYITEEEQGDERLTESGSITKSDINAENHDSRYCLLNDIMVAKNLQDYRTVDTLLEEYYRKEYLVERLFGRIK